MNNGGVFSEIRSRKVGKKTAGKSKGVFTWKLGFQISPASKWGDEKIKGFVKLSVIGVVAMAGLFGFYRGAASSALLRTTKEVAFGCSGSNDLRTLC